MCPLPTGNHFLLCTPWCSYAQLIKSLLYKWKDRSSDLWYPQKCRVGKIACNFSTWKVETTLEGRDNIPRTSWLARLAIMVSCSFVRRHCLYEKVESN